MNHFSLHKITDATSFTFSEEDYSLFKFGDNLVAKKFGYELAAAFIDNVIPTMDTNKQIVVLSSPYFYIPTATFAMKNQFVCTLNRWLALHNFNVVQEAKVHRTITYKDDYGALNAAERMQLIGNDSFHIDSVFVEGKTLVFLDDIRITGSHEKMITKMLDSFGLKNETHLLYFAALVNTSIHPNIENHLNYFKVKSIKDLHPIINSGHFIINTRIVKYILNTSANDFIAFIDMQSQQFKNELYDMALGNNYYTIDVYKSNLAYLRTLLN